MGNSRRRILAHFAGAGLACGLLTTVMAGPSGASHTKTPHYTIKFISPDPQVDPTDQMMMHFAKIVDRDTHGEVTVSNYFNGVTGPTTEEIPSIGANTAQMTYTNAALMGSYVPAFNFLQTPLLFTNRKVINKGLHSSAMQKLDGKFLAKAHARVLAWEALGFVDMVNSVHPLVTPGQIKGLKCRIIPGSKPLSEAYSLLGAEPVPIDATEVYTALQQGTVNCSQDPAPVLYGAKHYEVAKYLTVMPFQYNPSAVIISNTFYKSLPVRLRKIVAKDARASAHWEVVLEARDAARDVTRMKNNGAKVVRLNKKQIAEWVAAVKPMKKSAAKQYGTALVSAFGIKP